MSLTRCSYASTVLLLMLIRPNMRVGIARDKSPPASLTVFVNYPLCLLPILTITDVTSCVRGASLRGRRTTPLPPFDVMFPLIEVGAAPKAVLQSGRISLLQ